MVLLYLTDLLLHMSYNGLELVFNGMIEVEFNGRKILVKNGVNFSGIGRLGDFDNDSGDQLLQFLS